MEKFIIYGGKILTGIPVNDPKEIVDSDNYKYYHRTPSKSSSFTCSVVSNKIAIQYSFMHPVGEDNLVIYKVPKNNKKVKKII